VNAKYLAADEDLKMVVETIKNRSSELADLEETHRKIKMKMTLKEKELSSRHKENIGAITKP
jgi:hypothetical protein